MTSPEFDGEGNRIIEVPGIVVATTIGSLTLHWLNCRIRFFGNGYEEMNHLEYRDEKGVLHGLPINQKLEEQLMDEDFPNSYDPIYDEASKEWYVSSQMKKLDGIIDSI